MKNTTIIGICTGIGFALAAWSYPFVKPVLDKMLDTEYTCQVEYTLPGGIYQERTTDVFGSELRVGKFISGFEIVKANFVDGKFFGIAYHPEYKVDQIICNKK